MDNNSNQSFANNSFLLFGILVFLIESMTFFYEVGLPIIIFTFSKFIFFLIISYRVKKGDITMFFLGLGVMLLFLIVIAFFIYYMASLKFIFIFLISFIIFVSLLLQIKGFLNFAKEMEQIKYGKKTDVN